MIRQLTAVGVAVALCASLSMPAVSQDRVGMMVMKFAGERGWTANCEVSKANGNSDTMERSGRGRKSTGSLTFRRITGGTCTISVPDNTSLKVDISGGKSVVCPFEQTDPCSRTFASGDHTVRFGAAS